MRERNRIERSFAEFYDLYVADFERDIPVYLDLVAKHEGPILEAGCGTGRVSARLARAGYRVRAIDAAREPVEYGRERHRSLRDRVRFSCHDLRDAPLWDGFSTALVTLYAINGLIDVEEQRLFIRHLRKSLRPAGAVALDCFLPVGLTRPETNGEWRTIERLSQGRRLVLRDRRELLTPLLERRTLAFRIDDSPEDQIVLHRRYLPPAQLVALLEESGFENVCWIQGYDSTTLQPIDPSIRPEGPFIVLAEV